MQLIIDTDPGVDDAFAIALAALSDDVDLLGVTTVFGNVPLAATTLNARRLLALCKRGDVPVAAGADRPLVQPQPRRAGSVHGADGLAGRSATLPEPERPLERSGAVALLASLLEAADEPVTIAPIGPLTNIAALLAAHPGVREKIDRLVIMGGAVAWGNVTAGAEFNVWSDPEAAHRVLTGGEVPCVLVPMDLTHRCAVDAGWLATLAAAGAVGATLESLTTDYRAYYRRALGRDGVVLHDAVALAEAIRPGILHTEPCPVEVDCGFGPARGSTVVDRRLRELRPEGTVEVAVATDADLDGLRSFILNRLRQAGAR